MRYLIWPLRLVVYGAGFFLALKVVGPRFSGPETFLVGGPIAAAVIAFEIWVTARARGETVESVTKRRVLAVDHLLSRPGESMASQLEQRRQAGSLDPGQRRALGSSAEAEEVVETEAYELED
jgi:hypothetical protein